MEQLPERQKISLVERQRQEAFETVLDTLSERFPVKLKKTFESYGKEYALTSAEDCMVAFAQQNREVIETLYNEVKDKDDYRREQAIAKLYALYIAYEKTVVLYAELRSYYPTVARKVEERLPPLSHVAEHGDAEWNKINN